MFYGQQHTDLKFQRHNTPPAMPYTISTSYGSHCRIHSQTRRKDNIKTNAYKLKPENGEEIAVSKAKFLVGTSSSADLKIAGGQVAAEHAELEQKGKQVFLKALQGESVFDRTYTWIDDSEARPNVSYVLASGSKVSFGDQQVSYVVDFEEPSGANPLVEMLMKGMAASANPDIQKELSQ